MPGVGLEILEKSLLKKNDFDTIIPTITNLARKPPKQKENYFSGDFEGPKSSENAGKNDSQGSIERKEKAVL